MTKNFDEFIAHASSGFVCKVGASQSDDRRIFIPVKNTLHAAPTKTSLDKLSTLVSAEPEGFIEFYSKNDGGLLFEDIQGSGDGFQLLSISGMSEAIEEFRDSYQFALETISDDDPDEMQSNDLLRYETAIPIAIGPSSSNYFVIPQDGEKKGKVCLFLAYEWQFESFEGTFTEFLDAAATRPVELLNDILGSTIRYSDAKTPIQWYPLEYCNDIDCAQQFVSAND